MRRIVALGALGTAVLCATASPVYAAAPGARPGPGPGPVARLAAPAEATLCHGETKSLPVVSQYSGVIEGACGALVR
ncbi:hypothetical protein ACX9I7_27495 [Streptomyces sp. L500]|uniref:hypothetical protein n=1 Tax=Streptomyces abikoensis TaxID=97398 RepID=UPI00368B717A